MITKVTAACLSVLLLLLLFCPRYHSRVGMVLVTHAIAISSYMYFIYASHNDFISNLCAAFFFIFGG